MHYQISMFDEEPLTLFQEELLTGSGFENGKIRIYAAALTMPVKDFTDFLKKEYGIGGHSFKNGFADHDAKGIRYREWKSDYEESYSWSETAKEIKKLISIDRYLNQKEKIKANQYMKEKSE